MAYEDMLLEKKDNVATITLNAPNKLNALNVKMRQSLLTALDEIAKDDDVRAVVITGTGRGFCAGADLSGSGAGARVEVPRYKRMEILGPAWGPDAVFKLEKPTIAAVNGVAVGAGFSLALSCDIRIASPEARFGSVFVLRGLAPDCGATYLLPRVVGTSKALELMYTGDIIDAAEALRLGIVSRVVPLDDLMKVTHELAARIAKQPPLSVELTKRVVHRSMIDDLNHHLDWETQAWHICSRSEDNQEAVRAFLEKRPAAPFKGK